MTRYWQATLVPFAAGLALVAATLANFLDHNGYPLLRPEIGILAVGALLLTLVMACFYAAQRQWGRSVLEAVLAGLFIDFNFTSNSNYYLAIAAALAVGAYTYVRGTSLLRPMTVIGSVVLLTSAVGLGNPSKWISSAKAEASSSPNSARPETAILHIILDEHIGIEGIPLSHPDGARLKEELLSFYRENGFVLYGRAYSEHLHTISAVPHVLNYGKHLARRAARNGVEVGPTTHLNKLAGQGYELNILQSNFANFCTAAPFADCTTYAHSNPTATLRVPLSTVERVQLLLAKMFRLSSLSAGATWAVLRYSKLVKSPPLLNFREAERSASVGALVAFDAFITKLRHARPGDVYFAHILAPHFPHVVRADCSYLPWKQWKTRVPRNPVEERQQAYFNQVRCTTVKLREALNAFAESPAGANSIVIVHGDHGSRIMKWDASMQNLGKFYDSDLIAGFSTLFAIRAPGIPANYVREPESISVLLRDFSTSDFRNAPRPELRSKHYVTLADEDWKPKRRHPLPERW